jgi:hypothetical protein
VPNLSAFGGYVTYVADRAGDQQTITADQSQSISKIKFKLFDFDGHALHTGFDDQSDMPLVMVLDVK